MSEIYTHLIDGLTEEIKRHNISCRLGDNRQIRIPRSTGADLTCYVNHSLDIVIYAIGDINRIMVFDFANPDFPGNLIDYIKTMSHYSIPV